MFNKTVMIKASQGYKYFCVEMNGHKKLEIQQVNKIVHIMVTMHRLIEIINDVSDIDKKAFAYLDATLTDTNVMPIDAGMLVDMETNLTTLIERSERLIVWSGFKIEMIKECVECELVMIVDESQKNYCPFCKKEQ